MSQEKKDTFNTSFEEIIDNAKQITIQSGHHDPVFIGEGPLERSIFQTEILPVTNDDRLYLSWEIGHAIGQNDNMGQLRQAFFISKGWINSDIAEQQSFTFSSNDEDLTEVLVISAIKLDTSEKKVAVFKVIRNSNEEVTRLERIELYGAETFKDNFQMIEIFAEGYKKSYSKDT